MTKPYNKNLLRTLELSKEMITLADEGDRDRDDDSCGLVYSILRDTGYRLMKVAEKECENHKLAGKWPEYKKTTQE